MANRFPPDIDMETPSIARMYDYLLGGKDNFEVDRRACDMLLEELPETLAYANDNRAFLSRAVSYVAARGVDRFLDLGAGLPTSDNTHQVAQKVNPEARVLYVDNDPIVLAHGRALLAGGQGRTAFLNADIRNGADALLDAPETRSLLEGGRPVCVMTVSLLHCLPDSDDPFGLLERLFARLPSGSCLVYSHVVSDDPETARLTTERILSFGTPWGRVRSPQEAEAAFEGLELVSAWSDGREEGPRAVDCAGWRRPGTEPRVRPADPSVRLWEHAGVAFKP